MKLETYAPGAVADGIGEMEFRKLTDFNTGQVGVFWSEVGGPSPWEIHPDCNEMLQVIEGEIEVEVLPSGGGPAVRARVAQGSFIVIPQGCWHRQTMLARTKELYLTPGRTELSFKGDPR